MVNTNRLYRVTLRGMTYAVTGTIYGISYVIATDAEKAYQKVKEFLDDKDLGYTKDRVLDKVELIAEEDQYTYTGTMLLL